MAGRDLDIGIPPKESITINDMDTLIAKVKSTTDELEAATEELRKIRAGTGLILGQEIEEAE